MRPCLTPGVEPVRRARPAHPVTRVARVDGQPVQSLGPGDHFGEIALIARSSRTATVTSATDMRCLVLSEWKFRELVKRDPDLSWTLLEALAKQIVGE